MHQKLDFDGLDCQSFKFSLLTNKRGKWDFRHFQENVITPYFKLIFQWSTSYTAEEVTLFRCFKIDFNTLRNEVLNVVVSGSNV